MLTVDLSATDHVPVGGAIRSAGQSVLDRVSLIRDTVDALQSSWGAVPGLYVDTAHDDALYTALDDPAADADEVIAMARALRNAADVAAEAFDEIRRIRDRIRSVDLPAAQSAYDAAQQDTDPAGWPALRNVYERPLQQDADALVDDLSTVEADFAAAVAAASALRPGRSVKANFAYGTHDPAVVQALDRYREVMAPDASAVDLTAYYEHLATLTPEQIEALGALYPEVRTTPPPLPATEEDLAAWPGGAEGAQWWQGLSFAQQQALVLAMPALVGNTEGVPYSDRSAANMQVLDLAENDPDLTGAQRGDLAGIREALRRIPAGAGPDEVRLLLALRVDEEPVLAATAIGNPDTADTVTFSVPGMGAETSGAPGMMDEARNLFHATAGDRAVITWIGYDTPDGAQNLETLGSSQVLSNGLAYAGGINLAYALDGFAESRAHNAQYVTDFPGVDGPVSADPRTNVIAHSYGTPTSAYALTMTEHPVDALVMYGSVGVDPDRVPNAQALNVTRDAAGDPEVYATNAGQDNVAVPLGQTLSPLGGEQRISPTDDTFGAKAFSSDGDGSSPGDATNGHGAVIGPHGAEGGYGYVETGSQSLHSIANIVDGRGHVVPQVAQSPWDYRRETATAVLTAPDRYYHLLDAGVDIVQDRGRQTVDTAQQSRTLAVDAWQHSRSWSSPVTDVVIDTGQGLGNGAVDITQDVADAVTDWGQDVGEGIHDGLEDFGDAAMDAGRDLAEKLEKEGVWGLFR